ncbi:MAG: hypothetical protein KAJ39_00735 [Gammaproteobacteria bacterium]|nr:hypothetical protein [Gammaproteobacteria bacterium]
MKRLELSKTISMMPLTKELVSGMIMIQIILVCYLLLLDTETSLLFIVLFGVPLTLCLGNLLRNKSTHHHTQMAIVMFAVGGFGMMLGCNADLGRSGLLSLLSMCQSTPLTLLSGPGQVWQKILLTPWTYTGMFVGGNLAMLSIKEFRPGINLSFYKTLYLYAVCNIGMLIGMLLGEAIAIQISENISQIIAAGLMLALMLVGMTFGMIAMLAIAEGNKKQSATVV